MRSKMPRPILVGSTYYQRLAVPRSVMDRASGTIVSLPVGDQIYQIKLTTHAKVALRT